MQWDTVADKFRALTGRLVSDEKGEQLLSAVRQIDRVKVSDLMGLLGSIL
jgi:hypothetical protein